MSFTVSRSGQRAASMRRRNSTRSASGKLTRNGRIAALSASISFERCKSILDDLEETELEIGSLNRGPRGTLRVTAPLWFAGQAFAECLADYRRSSPEIVLDLSLEDRFVDIVAEGCDLALRCTREDLPAGLVARRLRTVRFLLAPRARTSTNMVRRARRRNFASHELVGVGDFDTWTFNGVEGAIQVPVRPVVRFRSLAGLVNAIAGGVGIAPLPEVYFEDPAFRDALRPVLQDYSFRNPTLYAVYVSRKYVPLKIRSFIDHLLDYAKYPAFSG